MWHTNFNIPQVHIVSHDLSSNQTLGYCNVPARAQQQYQYHIGHNGIGEVSQNSEGTKDSYFILLANLILPSAQQDTSPIQMFYSTGIKTYVLFSNPSRKEGVQTLAVNHSCHFQR